MKDLARLIIWIGWLLRRLPIFQMLFSFLQMSCNFM